MTRGRIAAIVEDANMLTIKFGDKVRIIASRRRNEIGKVTAVSGGLLLVRFASQEELAYGMDEVCRVAGSGLGIDMPAARPK